MAGPAGELSPVTHEHYLALLRDIAVELENDVQFQHAVAIAGALSVEISDREISDRPGLIAPASAVSAGAPGPAERQWARRLPSLGGPTPGRA